MGAKVVLLEEARQRLPCRRADGQPTRGSKPTTRGSYLDPTPLGRALAVLDKLDETLDFHAKAQAFLTTFRTELERQNLRPPKPVSLSPLKTKQNEE